MKKILLASCVAAISAGVNAELTPLSEYELHSVTGQAGVDIELDVGLTIGEIRYTDTEVVTQEIIQVDPDGDGIFEDQVIDVSDGDGGSFSISNITLGGGENRTTLMGAPNPNNSANLDGLVFAVDVESDGTIVINGYPLAGSGGIGAVDYLLTTGEIATVSADQQNRHVLVDSMSVYGGALGFRMDIDGPTNDILFQIEASVDDLDLDLTSGFGINIQNAMIKGVNFIEDKGIEDPSGVRLTEHAFVVNLNMDYLDGGEGVKFEFVPRATRNTFNIFDVYAESIVVGDANIGSVSLNDLDINGLSFTVKGH